VEHCQLKCFGGKSLIWSSRLFTPPLGDIKVLSGGQPPWATTANDKPQCATAASQIAVAHGGKFPLLYISRKLAQKCHKFGKKEREGWEGKERRGGGVSNNAGFRDIVNLGPRFASLRTLIELH
jgi:hypothetical protein